MPLLKEQQTQLEYSAVMSGCDASQVGLEACCLQLTSVAGCHGRRNVLD